MHLTESSPTPVSESPALRRAAHIISDVFSPLLVPSFGMILAVTTTALVVLPASTRLGATLGVFFLTCLLPMSFIFVLMKMGRVSDTSISNPRERTLPFAATILCYGATALYVRSLHAPMWLTYFFLGAALASAIAMLITHWWKISAHTCGLGGLCGVIFWLGMNNAFVFAPLSLMSAAIILVGCMASARLVLGHHTLGQTAAGALLGFATEFGLLALLASPAMSI